MFGALQRLVSPIFDVVSSGAGAAPLEAWEVACLECGTPLPRWKVPSNAEDRDNEARKKQKRTQEPTGEPSATCGRETDNRRQAALSLANRDRLKITSRRTIQRTTLPWRQLLYEGQRTAPLDCAAAGTRGHKSIDLRSGGLSLLQLPLAILAVLGLPGSEFKRGQWAFRLLGLALFGPGGSSSTPNWVSYCDQMSLLSLPGLSACTSAGKRYSEC